MDKRTSVSEVIRIDFEPSIVPCYYIDVEYVVNKTPFKDVLTYT